MDSEEENDEVRCVFNLTGRLLFPLSTSSVMDSVATSFSGFVGPRDAKDNAEQVVLQET